MDIRYSANPNDVKRYTTEELRREFHITGLYRPDTVQAVYSHVDRMVTLGVMPVNETVPIDKGIDVWANFGTRFFLERREAGLFNLGGPGVVACDGREYKMGYKDCLYIAMGTKQVTFKSEDSSNPARFYVVSAPAHCAYETRLITLEEAAKKPLGSAESSNKRVINQFITFDYFRGFEKLELLDIKPITLISGKNNAGKSSILEGIFLFLDHLAPESFTKINRFRGLISPADSATLWESAFYQMDVRKIGRASCRERVLRLV